jgi:hypothetical protein
MTCMLWLSVKGRSPRTALEGEQRQLDGREYGEMGELCQDYSVVTWDEKLGPAWIHRRPPFPPSFSEIGK